MGVVMALIPLLGSIGLMAGAIAHNQIDPSYATALTIPIANVVSLLLALLSVAISISLRRRRRDVRALKATMVLGIVCAAALALLFPLSNMGYLSTIR